MGYGSYEGREWDRNEQLIKFGNWMILQTSNWNDSARLILKNTQTDSIRIYNFNNHYTKKDSVWMPQNINSIENDFRDESYIVQIKGDIVKVHFKYNTTKQGSFGYGECIMKYKIENETGYIMKIGMIHD
jgi:hypothetical protein